MPTALVPTDRKAGPLVGVFFTLLAVGLVLSIVGTFVEGMLWLTVIGILVFLGAAAHATFARRSKRQIG